MTIGTQLDAVLSQLSVEVADASDERELLLLQIEALQSDLDLTDLEVLNVGNRTLDLDAEADALRVEIVDLESRLLFLESAPEPEPEPDPDPERPEDILYDSDLDDWAIWSVYGPDNNETYGSGNNSLHYHSPTEVIETEDGVILTGTDFGEGVTKRFLSGAISTRETGVRFGFGDLIYGEGIRFAFDVTIDEYSHAFWPAIWLRGKGGSGVHEVDILEGFTAQTGVDRVTQIIHSDGKVNHIKAPWPYGELPAGKRCTVWYECFAPDIYGSKAQVRMGIDDVVNVDTQDSRSDGWWSDDYWWDCIAQIQLGGNWVGDPRKPYDGTLQNGNTAYAKPVSQVPSWDGDSNMTIHRVVVEELRSW